MSLAESGILASMHGLTPPTAFFAASVFWQPRTKGGIGKSNSGLPSGRVVPQKSET